MKHHDYYYVHAAAQWKVLLILLLNIVVVVSSSSSIDADHRRLREEQKKAASYISENMPLIQVYIGNPAQQRTFAVSTSSDFTALPCQDCTSCGKHRDRDEFYKFNESFSFRRIIGCSDCSVGTTCFDNTDLCMVGKSRADKSSWSGYEANDFAMAVNNLMMEGEESEGENEEEMASTTDSSMEKKNMIVGTNAALKYGFSLNFVCQTTTRGYFNHVADGVLGLSHAPTSFLSQMVAAGKLKRPTFSICFQPSQEEKMDTELTTTGIVKLGGYEPEFLASDMLYAQNDNVNQNNDNIMQDPPAYKLQITKFYLQSGTATDNENHLLQLLRPDAHNVEFTTPEGGDTTQTSLLIDTSTTFLNFDQQLEQPFKREWKKITGKDFTKARQTLSISELQALPTLVLELKGAKTALHELDPLSVSGLTPEYNVLISVPAIHYMNDALEKSQRYRAEINFDSRNGSVFGLNAMKGYTISFEPDFKRIGFAKSRDCPKLLVFGDSRNSIHNSTTGSVLRNGAENDDDITIATTSATTKTDNARNRAISMQDDDIYVADGSVGNKDIIDGYTTIGGVNCNTASCRCLMSVGYVLVGTVLAVVYRLSRPKEKHLYGSGSMFHQAVMEVNNNNNNAAYHSSQDNNVARRKSFDVVGGTMA